MTAPARSDVRTAALSILREGRLQILWATCNDTNETVQALARVSGHYGRYAVELADGVITCTAARCAHEVDARCAHALALRLVTGRAES